MNLLLFTTRIENHLYFRTLFDCIISMCLILIPSFWVYFRPRSWLNQLGPSRVPHLQSTSLSAKLTSIFSSRSRGTNGKLFCSFTFSTFCNYKSFCFCWRQKINQFHFSFQTWTIVRPSSILDGSDLYSNSKLCLDFLQFKAKRNCLLCRVIFFAV